MTFDPKIQRYVIASLDAVLRVTIEDLGFKFWIEGIDFDEAEIVQSDNVVLRVIGPWYRPNSGRYDFEIFVMTTELEDLSKNAFKLGEVSGTVAQILSVPVPVNKLGGGGALIGCLDIKDPKNYLRVVNFGVADKNSKIKQMAVIVKYELCP